MTHSLLSIDAAASVVSALVPTDHGFTVRVYNTANKPDTVTVRYAANKATATDLSGKALDLPVTVTDDAVTVTVPPKSLASLTLS